VFADAGAIEDYCSSSNQAFVSYPASMNNGAMRDCNSFPDNRGILAGAVNHGVVLDTAVRSYSDVTVVAPKDCAWPNTGSGSDNNIPDYCAVRCENCHSMNSGLL